MAEEQQTVITVPAGKEADRDFQIDLGDILAAEKRQDEVAVVTPMKAPELLALFNGAWRDVDRWFKKLVAEEQTAERELKKRGAKLLVDDVAGILTSKGLASSTDTRNAVVLLDEQYQRLEERHAEIHAAAEYLRGKLKSFENAFTSVKKIMGEDTYNMAGRPNRALSGDASSRTPRPATPTAPPTPAPSGASARPGWGKPKY